jgi:hypothetical protein
MTVGRGLVLIGILMCIAASTVYGQRECSTLVSVTLPHATVAKAAPVPLGSFVPPVGVSDPRVMKAFKDVPAFCRVVVESRPSADSQIGIEIWLLCRNGMESSTAQEMAALLARYRSGKWLPR